MEVDQTLPLGRNDFRVGPLKESMPFTVIKALRCYMLHDLESVSLNYLCLGLVYIINASRRREVRSFVESSVVLVVFGTDGRCLLVIGG